MGIKGIYGEIGPGKRIALIKLAIDNFENTGRPLRIAIDVSIWQFQIQSGRGGSNPALRTLYYRLIRLLSVNVQPLFVFDGSQKPPFKRNKRTGNASLSLTDFNTKQLLKFFGFPYHIAPGEAEAECALLQREGLVDAVLSEDVDTLMFGCSKSLRNWSSEGSRGNHAPTHVTVYDSKATKEGKSGLDREGMILVALMSGGDYITEGIPGCGIKVACEAARAGFGSSLCKLTRSDIAGLKTWRESLKHELQTNESKYFRIKHKALLIPESFPNKEVLGYYTHPVVSSATKVSKLKEEIIWDSEVDVAGLRTFVAEAFDWTQRTGATKFIRGLAPALLVSKVRVRANRRASGFDDTVYTTMNELALVREICGRRQHFSTDGLPELRLAYHPVNITGLDFDAEADEKEDYGRDGLAPLGEDENPQNFLSEYESDGSSRTRSRSPTKRNPKKYDPHEIQKLWVPETIAKVGIPLMVEDYEEALRNPRTTSKPKVVSKRTTVNGGMMKGALDRYITIAKPTSEIQNPQSPKKLCSVSRNQSPTFLTPKDMSRLYTTRTSESNHSSSLPAKDIIPKRRVRQVQETEKPKHWASTQKRGQNSKNPWIIAQSSSPTSQTPHLSTVHISKPGLTREKSSRSDHQKNSPKNVSNAQDDSARSQPPSPSPLGKHSRPFSSSSNKEAPLDSHRSARLMSPTKKRIPNASVTSTLPVAREMRKKVATQEIFDPESPSMSASRIAVSLENHSENVPAESLQEPVRNTFEVKGKCKGKKFVMLRESLEGAWKEVNQEELSQRTRGRLWRASAVEVLDMTGD